MLGWRAGNIRQPGTVAKVHLVLDSAPAFTAFGGRRVPAGRILVGATGIDALDLAFDPSKYGRVPERPFLDVTVPTATDRTLAPGGNARRVRDGAVGAVLASGRRLGRREPTRSPTWSSRRLEDTPPGSRRTSPRGTS